MPVTPARPLLEESLGRLGREEWIVRGYLLPLVLDDHLAPGGGARRDGGLELQLEETIAAAGYLVRSTREAGDGTLVPRVKGPGRVGGTALSGDSDKERTECQNRHEATPDPTAGVRVLAAGVTSLETEIKRNHGRLPSRRGLSSDRSGSAP